MHMELLEILLGKYKVQFSAIQLKSATEESRVEIPDRFQAHSVLLKCRDGLVLGFYPATHSFKLADLEKILHTSLQVAQAGIESILLRHAQQGKILPLNQPKGLHVYIDEALYEKDSIYLTDVEAEKAYLIEMEQLNKIVCNRLIGTSFSEERKEEYNNKEEKNIAMEFKERVKAIHSLPPMPEIASQILMLRAKPDVNVEKIVEVISKDAILVAQIISYANSAFFGQAGSVKTLKDAIFRVLGVDAVMNMALALCIGKTFSIPKDGPIGAKVLWQSSVYSASLMQRLTMLMPWGKRPNPGTAYLVGLLHDIGLLVFGHLFTDEFIQLNQYLIDNPDEKLLAAEEKLLGITHTEMGKIVMRMWGMPDELITVVKYHHDLSYDDEHHEYVNLLILVECLLAPHGLSYASEESEMPEAILSALELDEEEVIMAADEVLQEGDVIKTLAKQMCA